MKTGIRNWMVLYTRSRWEKKIDKLLHDQDIDSFCPLVKRNRHWVDRQKVVEMPLFNSYIFVNATPFELAKAMQTNGVLTYITQGGKPAIIAPNEIERIKTIVKCYTDVETVALSDIKVGDTIKVKMGPSNNQEGEVHQIQGKSVIMIIKDLNCALTVKVDKQNILYKNS